MEKDEWHAEKGWGGSGWKEFIDEEHNVLLVTEQIDQLVVIYVWIIYELNHYSADVKADFSPL